jgi:hypothetical protein
VRRASGCAKNRSPAPNSARKPGPRAAGAAAAGSRISQTAANERQNDAASMISAHCGPAANSSGAASSGPAIAAPLEVACSMPLAFGRSAGRTRRPSTASRDGLKNWARQLSAATAA